MEIINLGNNIKYTVGHSIPTVKQDAGKRYWSWGEDNLYPQNLLGLYNTSATHQSIIKTKVSLAANILQEDPSMYNLSRIINNMETLKSIRYKLIFDRVLFGGYAVQINYLLGKPVSAYHIDFSKIRIGEVNDFDQPKTVFISADWADKKVTPIEYDIFDKGLVTSEPVEGTVQKFIYYFTEYSAGGNLYPSVEYAAAIPNLKLEGEITNHLLNTVSNGFTAPMIISVKSKPGETEREKFKKDVKNNLQGTTNSGDAIVLFSDNSEDAPEFIPLRNDNNANIYNEISNINTQKILTAHRLTSPVLAGIPGSGSIGGSGGEIEAANIWFKQNVISEYTKDTDIGIGFISSLFEITTNNINN